ncbi:MAG: KH domain-containing protein [Anaeroplasmataceae bacterium]|nr:KH domain-containing protein [Anaeroplasmataceae bacterium]MDE5868516.1 KH domain-containing protein [Anaeroplasmataceae bacterium]
MINFEELIKSLILPLVAYPEDVDILLIKEEQNEYEYEVHVHPSDFGRVIGKNGAVAKSIRTILYAGASKEGKRIHLDINSK